MHMTQDQQMMVTDLPNIIQHDETARLQRIDLFGNVVIWAMTKLKDQDRKMVKSWLTECILPMIDTMLEKHIKAGLLLYREHYQVWAMGHRVSFNLYKHQYQLVAGAEKS
jgi:hypothetical protein